MSDLDDLREAFKVHVDTQLQSFKDRELDVTKRHADLHAQRDELEKQCRELEEQKAALASELAERSDLEVSDDDIVELNVQGELMTTMRGTLRQVPLSRLAVMFSGRWEEKLSKDAQGRYFLDYQPTCFRKILEYLVAKQLAGEDHIPLVEIDPDLAASFEVLVHYLGLTDAFYGGPRFCRLLKSATVHLSDDALVARNDNVGEGYVLGDHAYKNELAEFTLAIETLDPEFARMFIGVMADGHSFKSDNSFRGNPGAFGWAGVGQVWVAGKSEQGLGEYPMEILRQGLELTLTLDCRSRRNVLCLRAEGDEKEYRISGLPEGKTWRIHVNMVGEGDQVRLVNVKKLVK